MVRATRARPVCLSFLSLLLVPGFAGCLDDPDAPVTNTAGRDRPVDTAEGPKAASQLSATDRVEAPSWHVRDWFGVHVWTKDGDPDGRHYEVVVVDETVDGWTLAANDHAAAREEAIMDLPIIGTFTRGSLSTTAYHLDWDPYVFPLYDGSNWHRTIRVRDATVWEDTAHDLAFRSMFDPAIDVGGTPHPGFRIEGRDGNGTLVVATDYVPAIGWFANLAIYDVGTPDPHDTLLRAISMGHGNDWAGTYHHVEAELLAMTFHIVVVPFPPASQPAPAATFDVPADAETVYGFLLAVAWNGTQRAILGEPDGTTHERQATHIPFSGDAAIHFGWIDRPAAPGTWSLSFPGAALVNVAGGAFWALKSKEVTF